MHYVQRYRDAHVFLHGQPYEVTDVMVAERWKGGPATVLCRVRNMMTDACTEDTHHWLYVPFKPEERTYRVTGHTERPPTLHLEDELGSLDVTVGDSHVDQLVWRALHRGLHTPASVTVLVMKNPEPQEGEQAAFLRLTGAYLRRRRSSK
jgi:hypothetical protein